MLTFCWLLLRPLIALEPSLPSSSVRLEGFESYSRLSIELGESVEVIPSFSAKGFSLLLVGLYLRDLGVPLGQEAAWLKQVQALKDTRIRRLTLREVEKGLECRGEWIFPSGEAALDKPYMEHFGHRSTKPFRYVLDVWLRPGPTKESARAAAYDAAQRLRVKRIQEPEPEERKKLSSLPQVATAPDLENDPFSARSLCQSPLDEWKDIFLEFYPVHQPVDFGKFFPSTTPDVGFPYYKPKKKTKESLYVHLALKFYQQGKFGLAMKTIQEFNQLFSKSDFQYEMKFLKANILIKMNFHEAGEKVLNQLMQDAKDSSVALQAGMYLTQKLMKNGNALRSLKNFLWMLRVYPDHQLTWVFHLGTAEALYRLRQAERALPEYAWVARNAPDEFSRAQGSSRVGDLYMQRFEYEKAFSAYSEAQEAFKQGEKKFPSLFLNYAESLYQLRQFERAEQIFTKFLEHYGGYPEGWRATYRLGEIWGRKPWSLENEQRSRGWFYETINRYPFALGATIARMRLAPCSDHAGFNLTSFFDFFANAAENFDGGDAVSMRNYDDYRVLSHIRTIVGMGTDEQTFEAIIQDLPIVKNQTIRKHLIQNANHLFRKIILTLLSQKKTYYAMAFYQARAAWVPPQMPPVLPDYLLELARLASEMELSKYAEKLIAIYEGAIQTYKQQRPKEDAIYHESAIHYLEARRIWFRAQPDYTKEKLSAIQAELTGALQKLELNSPWSYQKQLLLGLSAFYQEAWGGAIQHLSQAHVLNPHPALLQMLATAHEKAGDTDAALSVWGELAELLDFEPDVRTRPMDSLLGVLPIPEWVDVMRRRAELLEGQQKWPEAIRIYQEARVDEDPSVEYLLGRALLKVGKDREAREVIQALSEGKERESYWGRLATELLLDEALKEEVKNKKR